MGLQNTELEMCIVGLVRCCDLRVLDTYCPHRLVLRHYSHSNDMVRPDVNAEEAHRGFCAVAWYFVSCGSNSGLSIAHADWT